MRTCVAAVAVLALGLLSARPVLAHSEGLTPYRYVLAPPGVASEGPAEPGDSTQPIGSPGFAGTTDNQMQLTLPEGVLPSRPGQQGVRVQLDQLDPAELPALPGGLEPEGNAYRVGLTYAPSGAPVGGLVGPATLGLSAPAAPTALYELVGGAWVVTAHTPVAAEEGFSSVVELDRAGTFLQAYDATAAPAVGAAKAGPAQVGPAQVGPAPVGPAPSGASRELPQGVSSGALRVGVGVGVLVAGALLTAALAQRRRRPPAA